MRAQLNHSNDIPTLRQIALAGAGSGILASCVLSMPFLWPFILPQFARIITCPTELLKIKQQSLADSSPNMPMPTTGRLARQVLRKHGVSGLYRGITTTALRDSGYGVYFCMVRHLSPQVMLWAENRYSTSSSPGHFDGVIRDMGLLTTLR